MNQYYVNHEVYKWGKTFTEVRSSVVQLLKSATDTCRLSIHLPSGVKKKQKFGLGVNPWFSILFYFKFQKPPF
jgi:hypothetical protein